MLSRIRDGNGIAPPRNLIDLVTKAREAQMRKEARGATEYVSSVDRGVVEADALKRGLAALSKERVEDTLLAEAGDYAAQIERFRDGRAEHNEGSLAETLGEPVESVRGGGSHLIVVRRELRGREGLSLKTRILMRMAARDPPGECLRDADGALFWVGVTNDKRVGRTPLRRHEQRDRRVAGENGLDRVAK